MNDVDGGFLMIVAGFTILPIAIVGILYMLHDRACYSDPAEVNEWTQL